MSICCTCVRAFPLYLSAPLSSMPVQGHHKSHIVCDNGIVNEQYPWIKESVASMYRPLTGQDIEFVRIPSILDMDAMVADTDKEPDGTMMMMPEKEMVSGMERSSTSMPWWRRYMWTASSSPEPLSTPRKMYHRLRFDSSPYKRIMPYGRYCALEEMIGRITQSYLRDTQRHFCLLMEPSLMYQDSAMSFWTQSEFEKTVRITTDHHIGRPDLVLWTDQRTSSL